MKILIIHRYFYPDSPTYAFLLFKLAKSYVKYFESVSVLTSMPSYYGSSELNDIPGRELVNNIKIERLKLFPERRRNLVVRSLNSVLFGVAIFFHLFFKAKRYDVVQVATTPPVISALAVTLASKFRKIKFVYHCQDIYPDITSVNRIEGRKGFIYRLITKLDTYIMKNAWRVVVLSDDMKNHISKTRHISRDKIEVINNFDFNRNDEKINPSFEVLRKRLVQRKNIIYAGNLGIFQNLDLLFRAVNKIIDREDFNFIVVGEGIKKEELQFKYKHERIIFTGFQPNASLQKLYEYCHLGLAPVVAGIEKVAYPSKIISYTLSGIPVLTFSSAHSVIGRFIEENSLGINYSFDGTESLANKIIEALSMHFDREHIREIARAEYGEGTAFEKWKTVYRQIAAA